MDELTIWFDEWTVLDGNYGQLRAGQQARFALECVPHFIAAAPPGRPHLERVSGARYHFHGLVRYRRLRPHVSAAPGPAPRASKDRVFYVLEMGVAAYCLIPVTYPTPAGSEEGAWWAGELSLGVDPFFYFKDLCRLEGVPPLVYPWQVQRILVDRTPLVHVPDRTGGNVLARDEQRGSFAQLPATDTAAYPGSNYLLECRRLGEPTWARLASAAGAALGSGEELIGAEVTVSVQRSSTPAADARRGPVLARVLQFSEGDPAHREVLLKLARPLKYHGARCEYMVASPRYDGEGVSRLATEGCFYCSLVGLSEDLATSDRPFERAGRPRLPPLAGEVRRR